MKEMTDGDSAEDDGWTTLSDGLRDEKTSLYFPFFSFSFFFLSNFHFVFIYSRINKLTICV